MKLPGKNADRAAISSEKHWPSISKRERQEMIKGYQEMAALDKELAEESMSAVNEVWARYD